MKAGAFFTSAILLGLSFSFSAFAQSAELTQSQTFFLPTLHGKQEVCKIPAKLHLLQDGSSSFSAGDLKDEKKLCEINFYQNVGICPKLNSTNPGVLISLIPDGMSKEVFEDKHCGDDDPSQKIKAKFKQSISCSYTASGLAAYQLSRLLGGGRVPVAVSRTMDKEEHKAVVEKALKILGGSSDVIATTWNQMNKAHSTVPLSSRLFNDQNQLYGFLSDNPTGEDQYTEVSGSGDYETRYQRFVQQPPFLRVSNPAGLAAIANSSEANKILPVLVQMKDVSDMVILDTLLSQDDRIGNIHFKYVWYIPENGQMTEEKSKARKPRKGEDSLINYRGFFTAIVPA